MTRNRGLLILLLIVIAGLSLYWFQIRPEEIRKNCEYAIFSKETAAYKGSYAVRQNNKYRQCLIRNGLAPESIFVNTE